MEDNDDAHFTVGSMSVPVVKGSLVRFNGALSHHTIINFGSIELLGPFEGGWLQPVGAITSAPPDFETESPTDVLSSTSSKSGKVSSSKSSNGRTSSPTATKSSKSKAAKLFKGKASGRRSSKTSTDTSADDVSGETGTANIEETTKEDLSTTVPLDAHDFDLASMSMQLADGDGEKKKLINHRPTRRKVI